ncbi:DnaD domain-containing protein [Lactococcus termiticola]|uniref:DNA replication protein DnaD n=1 Tax=Lactococcus termiticola TaxID=2169526 RepID=A0A2R5HGA0_9LACT|nr:DnaD domain protein [Lactococcus termiticola]GBG97079.1 DNA replication protein DnaD [Lactococcus termiticola]
MTYYQAYQEGAIHLPKAFLDHFAGLFKNADDFLVWLYFLDNKDIAPSEIAQKINKPLAEVNQSISQLQEIGALKLTFHSNGQDMNFDVSEAFRHLDQLSGQLEGHQQAEEGDNPLSELIQAFEAEMGMITPMQQEEIQALLYEDQYEPETIRLALKEATLNRKTNFNYIKAILKNWRNDGVSASRQELKQEKNAGPEPESADNFFIPLDGPWSH